LNDGKLVIWYNGKYVINRDNSFPSSTMWQS